MILHGFEHFRAAIAEQALQGFAAECHRQSDKYASLILNALRMISSTVMVSKGAILLHSSAM